MLLALLSWVFISTINPDVLFIKQPGSNFATSDVKNLGSCYSSYDPANQVCVCVDNFSTTAASADACTTACKTDHCNIPTANPCIKPGSPVDGNSLNFNKSPYKGKCQCVDQAFVPLLATTCQESCEVRNCLVADFRIGLINSDDAQAWAITSEYEIAKTYAIHNPSFTEPLEYNVNNPTLCDVSLAINAVDYTKAPNGVIPTFTIDLNAGATPGNIITAGPGPYATPLNGAGYIAIKGCVLPTYDMLSNETECKKEFWFSGLLCPVTVAADFGGTIKRATKYIKLFKP